MVAGEIERVQSTYGEHASTAVASSHHNWGVAGYKFGPFNRFMNMMHYTPICDNPDSWEGWQWGATHMFGFAWRLGMVPTDDLLVDTMQNSEFMVFWSADPSSNRGGYNGQSNHRVRTWLKEMGMPTVCIDPHYNYTAAVMDSDWLPVYPGGDTALAAAIAYTWMTEGTYDKEYIAEKTHRFDAFEDYILGREDGVPKTSQWAEEKCGIPARKIRALARFWASKRTCLAAGGRGGQGSACRTAHGTEWPRMMVALLAMQGWGKPGRNLWSTTNGVPVNNSVWFPGYSEPGGWMGMAPFVKYKLTAQNPTKQKLMRLTVPEAIMEGHDEYLGDGICGESLEQQFKVNKYPIEGEVKMFYRYGSSYMGTMVDTNKWVRLYQSDKLECVVNQDCWFGGESRFADIILPACTTYERDDVGEWSSAGGYAPGGYQGVFWRTIVRQQKCIEPLGESKSDYEIFTLIADRLGKKELYTDGGKTELDWCKAFFEESDLYKQGLITWEEFNEKGYYIVPVPESQKIDPSMRWYVEGRITADNYSPLKGTDKANRLGTYTGKIEFVSESLKALMPEDDERPLTPKYIPSWEGRESELYKKYPLQIISPHPRFSFHTHYDKHMEWMDEVPTHRIVVNGYAYWTLRINPADAAERGIGKHDIVEVYNDRGSVLCAAVVTDRVPKGVLHSYGCSAKYDPITPEPGATDRGGCINLLTPSRMISKRVAGMAVNSCLVEVRKWEV